MINNILYNMIAAEILMFDWDDEEVLKAKSNLYTQDNDGVWSLNKDIEHRQMSNNSIVYETKPSREQWKKHMELMRFSGEPKHNWAL